MESHDPANDEQESSAQFLSNEENKLVDTSKSNEFEKLTTEDTSKTIQECNKDESAKEDTDEKSYLELLESLLYESELNPTYEMFLQKTTEIPEHMLEPKFLSKNVFEKVILASYKRSGNTLMRKYLEDITGVITGTDNK